MSHRFIPASEEPSETGIDPSHTLAIKRWVQEKLQLTDEDVVTVTESPCVDANCPVIETAIAVFPAKGAPRHWRLQRPKVAVTKAMVLQALDGKTQKS